MVNNDKVLKSYEKSWVDCSVLEALDEEYVYFHQHHRFISSNRQFLFDRYKEDRAAATEKDESSILDDLDIPNWLWLERAWKKMGHRKWPPSSEELNNPAVRACLF